MPDDATAWFEQLYRAAAAGRATVPWDRGEPNPLLVAWTEREDLRGDGRPALVVGAGLGDDAVHLAGLGFAVTAFDVAPTAVAAARERHAGAPVDFVVADLLDAPPAWDRAFALVLESITVQSLPPALHEDATAAVSRCVAPGGTLLVLTAGREPGEEPDGPPWPLTAEEVDAFTDDGLAVVRREELGTGQERRWRVTLRRP